jgi:hypothetical protein
LAFSSLGYSASDIPTANRALSVLKDQRGSEIIKAMHWLSNKVAAAAPKL